LVAHAIWPPLSSYIWREFLKLSKPAPSNSTAEQQKDIAPSQPKRPGDPQGTEP
jgi:hypothetical protein